MNTILLRAKEIENEIISNRRQLHKNPELGNDLSFTSQYVMDKLCEMGYEPIKIGESGVVATVGKGNKTILLRADMDALPMKETSGEEFSAMGEYAHACGHDTHTAMLLGAARLLKEREQDLKGIVKLMFQPDEEGLTGAKLMIDGGVLENPKVDAAMAMHISIGRKCGVVATSYGTVMASCDRFTININGKGSHGADPHLGVDPINIAVHVHMALQELMSRETAPGDNAVLTIGRISAGTAPNIIPEEAVMEGTLRCFNADTRKFLLERLKEVCNFTAKSFRGECTVEISGSVPPVMCNDNISNAMEGYVKECIGEENTIAMPNQCGGSEDFAYVLEQVPGTYLALGAGTEEEGYIYNVHNPSVRFNENSFHVGAAVYAFCAMKWIEDNSK